MTKCCGVSQVNRPLHMAKTEIHSRRRKPKSPQTHNHHHSSFVFSEDDSSHAKSERDVKTPLTTDDVTDPKSMEAVEGRGTASVVEEKVC